MSKFLKIFVALAVLAAFATPAFAIEADFGGFLQVRGLMSDNMDGDDDTADQQDGVDQRFRLYSTFALNEDVKAVFKLEEDHFWGAPDDTGDLSADGKNKLEVKNIYLDFNIPGMETNVKAGTQYIKLGRGLINGDDVSGLQIRHTPVKGQSFAFFWIKSGENGFGNDDGDGDYYQVQYDHSAAGWHFAPYVGYYDMAEANFGTGEDDDAYFVGLDIDGKMGPLGLAFTGVFNDWERESNGTDGSSFALFAKATYKMDATTLSLEAATYGDEDNGGNFLDVQGYNNFAEIATGGRFDIRTGLGRDEAVFYGDHGGYVSNWQYIKAGLAQKFGRTKGSIYLMHIEQAEDVGTTSAQTLGQEVDAYYDISVTDGLTFTLAGAYLLADDDFGAGDDAWKLGTALTYKF